MKIQHLIPILFLAAVCTVSAQTNPPTTPAVLTTNQAEAIAIRLLKEHIDKMDTNSLAKRYMTNFDAPSSLITFENTTVSNTLSDMMNKPPRTNIRTRFADGHWITIIDSHWYSLVCVGTVEIAPDGSTNSVSVESTRIKHDG